MTITWTPEMVATLHAMIAEEPRPTLQTMGERLGVDRSVVARYCALHDLPTKPGRRPRVRSAISVILGRERLKVRRPRKNFSRLESPADGATRTD